MEQIDIFKVGDNSRKVIVITGANRGIGFEVARKLAKEDISLVLACRNLIEGEKAKEKIKKESTKSQIRVIKLDLCSFSSIRDFSKRFSQYFQRIHMC